MDLDKGETKMVVGTWNTTRSRENAPINNSDEKFGCPCGRSPIGKCVGWHRLSDTGYVDMFAKWQKESQGFKTFKERDEFFENNKVPKKTEPSKHATDKSWENTEGWNPLNKEKTEPSLEEAYDAIVMGLGIMAEGLGGDIDPDINQEAQDEILSSTGKSVDGKDEEK